MATILNKNHPSMLDLIKAENFDGNTKDILGEMATEDAFSAACPWFTTNDGVSHKEVSAEKLGKGKFMGVNEGRDTTSSDITVKTSNVCLYTSLSQVNDTLLRANPSLATKLRTEQHELNLEGIVQDFTEKIFYSKAVDDPKGFNGLAQRRSSMAINDNKFNNKYLFKGDLTTGKGTSIYLIQFGQNGVCLRHQEGTKSGFDFRDRGMKSYRNDDGTITDFWEMEYNIWSLLSVKDPRTLLRYSNIDPAGGTKGVDTDILIKMKNQLPRNGKSAGAFVNRDVITQIEIALSAKSNIYYTRSEIENYGDVTRFMNIPLFLQDCISSTEDLVS